MSDFKTLYLQMLPDIPVNCRRPRHGNLRKAEPQAQKECMIWLQTIFAQRFLPMRKVIRCIPKERWELYEQNGWTNFEEYVKRTKLEQEFRALWNNTMPEILLPKKKAQEEV